MNVYVSKCVPTGEGEGPFAKAGKTLSDLFPDRLIEKPCC